MVAESARSKRTTPAITSHTSRVEEWQDGRTEMFGQATRCPRRGARGCVDALGIYFYSPSVKLSTER